MVALCRRSVPPDGTARILVPDGAFDNETRADLLVLATDVPPARLPRGSTQSDKVGQGVALDR